MNRDKHIYEGWTVGGFIDELEPIFDIITKGLQMKRIKIKGSCISKSV